VRYMWDEVIMANDPAVPVWERRLSRRSKLFRILVIAAALAVGVAVLNSSTGIVGSVWQHLVGITPATLHAPSGATSVPWTTPPVLPEKSAGTLHMTAWQTIPAPEGGRSQIAFTPFPENPASIYACAAVRNIPGQGPLAGPVKLWSTSDSGQHWRLLPLPALTADTCIMRLSAGAPRQILLLSHTTGPNDECLAPTLLLSEDSGNSWTQLTPPHLKGNTSSSLQLCDAWATSSYLYWYEADICSSRSPPLCDELLRSTDNGGSWQHADSGLTTGFFDPIWTNAGGGRTLLAGYLSAADAAAPVPITSVWISSDSGAHWRPLGNFPHTSITRTYVSLAPDISGVIPSGTLYRELIGPTTTTLHNVAESSDGESWVTLPPLPAPGTDVHHDGIAQIVGVGIGGGLLVLGPTPRSGVPSSSSGQAPADAPQPNWLWAWNPATQRWDAAPGGLLVIPEDSTISWGSLSGDSTTSPTIATWIWLVSPSASGTLLTRALLTEDAAV
jgi:hypothetical protein